MTPEGGKQVKAHGSRKSEIRASVLSRISSGEWPTGQRIPSEHELMAAFGVSRMTAHTAISELAREGVLTRVKGLGTFVAPPRTHLTLVHVGDPAEDIRARGGEHAATVVLSMERAPTAAERDALKSPNLALVHHLVVLHHENGAPSVLEDRLVNPLVAPDFLKQDFTQVTAFAYLMALAPYPEGRHVIRAVEASERLKTLLALQPGEPCLELERTTWVGGQVVTVARLYHPGLRFELVGAIERR
jgi:GntR family histidine utilization transcriptional repressor